jgi:hypothetical protein
VKGKKGRNGYPSDTVEAQNATSTATPVKHLQLPGVGIVPEYDAPPSQHGVVELRQDTPIQRGKTISVTAAARKPWSTPTLTEISFEDLPEELRPLALGLPVPGRKREEASAYW